MAAELAQEEPAPPPTFDALRLSAEVRKAVDELGYVHPTPVQRAVFDPVTRGVDLVVQARTGTGKTAAYGLPVIDSIVRRSVSAVQVLVLCPTRELALQVGREIEALAKYRGTKVASIYGGAPMAAQVQKILDGAQVVAGTPGRVLDHLRRGTLDPKGIRAVVLDESDEMLSMGFLPQIDEILSHVPSSRQTLLFSATLPPEIQRLAETRQKNPEYITLSGDHIGALEISHFVYISRADKTADLVGVLEVENPESAIVFCNTRDATKKVASALQQQGFDADWLNADLGQTEREKVMEATRKGNLRFLVCTDVAARGIDISHLTHVINYDFPESMEQYVHRTGRTGRAGRTGTAISLIEPSDIGNLYMLRLTYKIRPVEKQLPTQRDLKTRAETDLVQMFADLFANQVAHPDDLALARRIFTHEGAERIVAGLLRDHLGARPSAPDQAAAARRSAGPKPVPRAVESSPERSSGKAVVTPSPRVTAGAPALVSPTAATVAVPPPRAEEPRRTPVAASVPTPPYTPIARPAAAAVATTAAPVATTAAPVAAAAVPVAAVAVPVAATAVIAVAPAPVSPALPAPIAPPPLVSPPRSSAVDSDVASDRPRKPERRQRAETEGPTLPPEPPRLQRVADPIPTLRDGEAGNASEGLSDDAAELFVNVGRKDGAKASDFYAVLEKQSGITIDDTDYVNVRQRHTFIGIKRDLIQRALDALNGAVIAGREASAEPSRSRS